MKGGHIVRSAIGAGEQASSSLLFESTNLAQQVVRAAMAATCYIRRVGMRDLCRAMQAGLRGSAKAHTGGTAALLGAVCTCVMECGGAVSLPVSVLSTQ